MLLKQPKNRKIGFIEKYTLTSQGLTTGILHLLPLTIWCALRPPFMKINSHTTKGSDWLSGHSKLGNVNTIYRKLALLHITNYWLSSLHKSYYFLYFPLIFQSVYFLNKNIQNTLYSCSDPDFERHGIFIICTRVFLNSNKRLFSWSIFP